MKDGVETFCDWELKKNMFPFWKKVKNAVIVTQKCSIVTAIIEVPWLQQYKVNFQGIFAFICASSSVVAAPLLTSPAVSLCFSAVTPSILSDIH